MPQTTYICGTCGQRFKTFSKPKGCPICWSENITASGTGVLRGEELFSFHMKAAEESARKLAKYKTDFEKERKNYLLAYWSLYQYCKANKKRHTYHSAIQRLYGR